MNTTSTGNIETIQTQTCLQVFNIEGEKGSSTWKLPLKLQTVKDLSDESFGPIQYLYQADFDNGTVRLRTAGRYLLGEHIIFNPNPTSNWMPRADQAELYPTSKYHLGFFAAITIEGSGILLDGNGFSLKQSREHYLQQRFFACIELADQPFIPAQGPSPMGLTISSASNSRIQNMILGLSSHHGIHGNGVQNIILDNITTSNYEIAGIAINGGVGVLLSNITVSPSLSDVPVLATYSHARFMEPFWNLIDLNNTIQLRGITYTGNQIKTTLQTKMGVTFSEFISTGSVSDVLFNNIKRLADGDQYGLVFNKLGVAVNALPTVPGVGNTDIYIQNVNISDIRGAFNEIPALPTTSDVSSTAYSAVQSGPVGDVFRYLEVTDPITGFYIGNALSDAQIYLSANGFGSITAQIREWAALGNVSLNSPYLVGNGDSMAHFAKGSIGLFLAGGNGIHTDGVVIDGLTNEGVPSVLDGTPNSFKGINATGVVVAGCVNVDLYNVKVINIVSANGDAIGTSHSANIEKISYIAQLKCNPGIIPKSGGTSNPINTAQRDLLL